ncbi:MAG TPA: hypothetical protein VGO93_06720 [Candidatus Xenobia bacterium]
MTTNLKCWLVGLLCAVAISGAVAGPSVDPTADEIIAEESWLRHFGLRLPAQGVWGSNPYDEPWTPRSFLVPHTWYPSQPPAEVQAGDLVDDLPLLQIAMQQAYAGWDLAQARGWDWDAWFSRWARSLSVHVGQSIPLAQALSSIGELRAFQRDNLSGPVGYGKGQCASQCWWSGRKLPGAVTAVRTRDGVVHPLSRTDPAQGIRTAWIDTPAGLRISSYVSGPSDLGTVSALRCKDKWWPIGAAWNPSPEQRYDAVLACAHTSTDVPSYHPVNAAVGYLRLPTFDEQTDTWLHPVLEPLYRGAPQLKLLIVDLRGTGGEDPPVDELAPVVGLPTLHRPEPASTVKRSCLATALAWGDCERSLAISGSPRRTSEWARIQAALDALGAPPADDATERTVPGWDYRRHAALRGASPAPGHPRLLVLVDHHTRAGGEVLAWLLASLPGCVLAGTNTAGQVAFQTPGTFLLPHSGIVMRLAERAVDLYGDGRSVDGYGLDVDVLLPTEASQRPYAIESLAASLAHHGGFSF